MTSIRTRLSVSTALVAAFAICAQWWFVSRGIRTTVESQIMSRLAHDAETIASAVEMMNGKPVLSPDKIGMEYRRAYSGHYYLISGGGHSTHSRSLWDFYPDLMSCETGRAEGPLNQKLMVHCMPLMKAGNRLRIWVAEETTVDRDSEAFQNRLTIASVIALLAILGAQQLAVYAGFAPLRAAVRRLQKSDTLAAAEMPGELRPFAGEIERLVNVLKKRLEISRQTAGNLAHEQKTHLASIQAAADSILPQASATVRTALEEISKSVQNLKSVAERHMARSAMAGEARAGALFDWQKDIADLRRTLLRIYADKSVGVEIAYRAAPNFLPEREDGIELFGILLDNACRFARAKVVILVEREFVEIQDDGPGCEAEQMALLTIRGARIDENTESGLGLSIARDIAESYGWRLVFESAAPAGLKVRLVQANPRT